jgi:PAS domain S-box-containing protein
MIITLGEIVRWIVYGLRRGYYRLARWLLRGDRLLWRSERKFRSLLESAPEAIVIIDAHSHIALVNRQAEQLFGYKRQEIIGQSISDLISERSRAEHRAHMRGYMRDPDARPMGMGPALYGLRKDGSQFPAEISLSPLETDAGLLVSSAIRDITERREIERAKDEFVSVVSHELRTPLTSIRGSLGLLASGALGPLPPKGQRMVEIAVLNTDRLVRLINDILDIERIDSGTIDLHPRPCDGAQLIRRAIQGVEQFADQALVTLAAEGEAVQMYADPDRVHQVLTNLISNAVKFSPASSTVRVRCTRRDSEVLFEVADDGKGIPAGKLAVIFERFGQVDASDSRGKGGTGLGLAICRKIVEHHGGRIWVDSQPGAGSTFSFVLPAQQTNGSPPEPQVAL